MIISINDTRLLRDEIYAEAYRGKLNDVAFKFRIIEQLKRAMFKPKGRFYEARKDILYWLAFNITEDSSIRDYIVENTYKYNLANDYSPDKLDSLFKEDKKELSRLSKLHDLPNRFSVDNVTYYERFLLAILFGDEFDIKVGEHTIKFNSGIPRSCNHKIVLDAFKQSKADKFELPYYILSRFNSNVTIKDPYDTAEAIITFEDGLPTGYELVRNERSLFPEYLKESLLRNMLKESNVNFMNAELKHNKDEFAKKLLLKRRYFDSQGF